MAKFKKIFTSISALTATIAPVAAVVACGDDGASIQMVTDGSPIEDKSFNEQARDGAVAWGKANGKKASASQAKSGSSSDLKSAWQSAIDSGAEYVITTGFGSDKPFKEFAEANSEKKFVYIDGAIDGTNNLIALTYKTEQAAFLAGIATGIMLNMNYDKYRGDGGLIVGAWGGQDIQPIWAFIGGFQQGIAYFNQNIAKDRDHMIKWVNPGTGRTSMISGNWDAGKGTPLAEKLIDNKKADVIMGVAGSQSNDGVAVIKDKQSESLIVGVDTDQTIALGNDGKYAFTSIMKDIYSSVQHALDVLSGKAEHAGIVKGKTANAGLDADFVKLASGLIDNKTDELVDAGKSTIRVHFSNLADKVITDAFKPSEIAKWSKSGVKSILDIANTYKKDAKKATDTMWSGFTGVDNNAAQAWDEGAAVAEKSKG